MTAALLALLLLAPAASAQLVVASAADVPSIDGSDTGNASAAPAAPGAGMHRVRLLSGEVFLQAGAVPALPEDPSDPFRRDLEPLYDERQERAVIAFVGVSQGLWRVYDLEGRMVRLWEQGLEKPLVDPISVLAGGVVAGSAAGAVGAGLQAAARSLVGNAAANALFRRFLKKKSSFLDEDLLAELRRTRRQVAGAEGGAGGGAGGAVLAKAGPPPRS
ncbi:MAG TPA: hypothetical protein DCM05_14305 [Elusimicrobia bacterium]|nr:hypothetical protein [Elusimicrobiota bacterium]